jgi:hypothetical protein
VNRGPFAHLFIRTSFALGLLGSSCSIATTQPTTTEVVSVSQLNGNKSAYLGKRISVQGTVYVLTLSRLLACRAGEPCPQYDDALLALVDSPPPAVTADQLVRLYRRSAVTRLPEQIHCKILREDTPTFDCGAFVRGTITTINGVFTSEQVPDQVVGDSTGRIEVVRYREVYYLLIES